MVQFSWSAPSDQTTPPEKYSIKIIANTGDTVIVETEVSALTYTHNTGLGAGQAYTIQVSSINYGVLSDAASVEVTLSK